MKKSRAKPNQNGKGEKGREGKRDIKKTTQIEGKRGGERERERLLLQARKIRRRVLIALLYLVICSRQWQGARCTQRCR